MTKENKVFPITSNLLEFHGHQEFRCKPETLRNDLKFDSETLNLGGLLLINQNDSSTLR